MQTYLNNVFVAAVLFPVISAVLALPYAIYQYRSFGSISVWKTFLVFTFIFYLMCAYFMVILPLPADRTAFVASAAVPQLQPGLFLGGMRSAAAWLDPASPASWARWLASPSVYTVLFNVLLTMPFGIYLRYLFQRRWWQVLILGFLFSLFFEVSQVTGLFGIYEHPYRLFDVDDLITNTTGAMLGFWVSFPLCAFLPDIDDVEEAAIERGAAHTTFTRRLVAFIVDAAVTAAVFFGLRALLPELFSTDTGRIGALFIATGVAFMLVPMATRGQTIGHKACGLRVVRPDGSSARPWSYVARYGLIIWCFLLVPVWFAAVFPEAGSILTRVGDEASMGAAGMRAVLLSVYGVWLLSIVVRAVRSAFKHPFVMLNGIMTNTRVMSVAQADRLRAARHEESLDEELHELDIDPLGTDIDDAFDASFDSTSADEGVDFDPEEQGHI